MMVLLNMKLALTDYYQLQMFFQNYHFENSRLFSFHNPIQNHRLSFVSLFGVCVIISSVTTCALIARCCPTFCNYKFCCIQTLMRLCLQMVEAVCTLNFQKSCNLRLKSKYVCCFAKYSQFPPGCCTILYAHQYVCKYLLPHSFSNSVDSSTFQLPPTLRQLYTTTYL